MSHIKWAAFKWFIRDNVLTGAAVLQCFIQWTTVLPLITNQPTNQPRDHETVRPVKQSWYPWLSVGGWLCGGYVFPAMVKPENLTFKSNLPLKVKVNCPPPPPPPKKKKKFDPNHWFFAPCDIEMWWMTLENNRAPLLYYIKLCPSFQIHWWIETEVTVRKHPIWVKIADFLSCLNLKFDGWLWKTIGHLFYTTPSFVHHFKSIGEFKLDLTVRKRSIWVKIGNFCPMWPWNLTDDLAKQ